MENKKEKSTVKKQKDREDFIVHDPDQHIPKTYLYDLPRVFGSNQSKNRAAKKK
jgi:hypothetical protein